MPSASLARNVRLVLDGHLRGAENMRRDEALLEHAEPALRLYGWRPAAVSLGRSQGPDVVDGAAVRELGVEVVARATGGGAILHNEAELTYAVVLPHDHPGLPRDIPGSFAYMSGGVVGALRRLGLDATVEHMGDERADALCYLRRQGTNVLVGGRKVSGGAQRRTDRAVLQHGTVIVERDERRMARLLRADPEAVRAKVTSLREERADPGREKLVELLVDAYAEAFGVTFDRDP